ncbi:MAG: ROK family protein, partial [Anaerolineae bacterium]|nr:ROK family protein [Anaerolineae bacterium]
AFTEENIHNLVMILVNISIEIGIAFGNGVYHHSGDLGLLRVSPEGDQLTGYLGWAFVKRRADELRQMNPDTILPLKPTYLDIYYGYQRGDWLCRALVDELAIHLGQILAWITGLTRPDHIVLAGGVVEIGEPLLQLATQYATELLPPDLVNAVTFSLSEDQTLSVTGTLAHALDRELGIL